MAKVVLVCGREGLPFLFTRTHVETLADRLTPDNIAPEALAAVPDARLLTGIFGPSSGVKRRGGSICAGWMTGPQGDWWRPGADVPDGTYALFRADETAIELVTDAVASRTIWYALTDRLFVASTSQRAIVFFLRDFDPEASSRLWMLSSGTLGYRLSWDRRIRCLKGGERLTLNRKSWSIKVADAPLDFEPREAPPEEHIRALKQAMADTFGGLNLDLGKWVLPLSGGMDSRAILLHLKDSRDLRTITWGSQAARLKGEADGSVAASLAQHFNLRHEYFEIDPADEPAERILDRFLIAGEGRIDQLAGYADGFGVWRILHERGCAGIIRGDTSLNGLRRKNTYSAYERWNCLTCADYSNLARLPIADGSPRQARPEELARRPYESFAAWRDRFYVQYGIPVRLAPLNDLKLPYVEVANPLLSRRVISCVRQLPEELRTDKRAFRDAIAGMGPDIAFSTRRATARMSDTLGLRGVLRAILERIDTRAARDMFSNELIDYALNTARAEPPVRGKVARKIGRGVEKARRRLMPGGAKRTLNPRVLAFRVFIVCEMDRLLRSDGEVLKTNCTPSGSL